MSTQLSNNILYTTQIDCHLIIADGEGMFEGEFKVLHSQIVSVMLQMHQLTCDSPHIYLVVSDIYSLEETQLFRLKHRLIIIYHGSNYHDETIPHPIYVGITLIQESLLHLRIDILVCNSSTLEGC
jgi:hypothetical protein